MVQGLNGTLGNVGGLLNNVTGLLGSNVLPNVGGLVSNVTGVLNNSTTVPGLLSNTTGTLSNVTSGAGRTVSKVMQAVSTCLWHMCHETAISARDGMPICQQDCMRF